MRVLNSYTELSQSGNGWHVLVRATMNGHPRHRCGPIEIYDKARFAALTGDHVGPSPLMIEERQEQLDMVVARYLPKPEPVVPRETPSRPVDVNDRDLLERAFAAHNGSNVRALYHGLWEGRYASRSEADLALCSGLAFWTGRDPERIDRLFRSSGLYRSKWDREDYRRRTIETAIAGCLDVYEPHGATPRESGRGTLRSHMSLRSQAWPEPLREAAYHGVTGEFVRLVEPETEADPAAVLVQFLVAAANMIGRGPYFVAGARRHYANIFAVVVGKTAKGRKGTSLAPTVTVLGAVDPVWAAERRQPGLSSGEGLIYAVRDRMVKTNDSVEKTIDEGVTDKRLLVVEEEFASVLKMLQREGNTLSTTLRQAFDDGHLRTLTRQAPISATGAHFSLLGHITLEELRRELTATDAMSGLANRFGWVLSQRSKLLPDGGDFHHTDIQPLVTKVQKATAYARKQGVHEHVRSVAARELWHEVYPELSRDAPGLLGAAIARAEAITMRLALIYSVLDSAPMIEQEHLAAGLEVWRYLRDSATFIFGDRTGDEYADRIEHELERNGELSRTAIRDLFGRHGKPGRVEAAITALLELDRAELVEVATAGRTAQMLRQKRPKRPKGAEESP